MRKETQNRRNVPRKLANNLDFNLTIQATHDARRRFDDKSQVRQACPFFFFLLSRLLSKKVSARRQREKERQRGGGKGEVIRCATVASDTLSDKEGFSRREEVSRSRLRRGEGRVARKKQRKEESSNSMERYLHCAQWKILGGDLSAGRFSLPRRALATLARRTPCDPRVCIRKGRSFQEFVPFVCF